MNYAAPMLPMCPLKGRCRPWVAALWLLPWLAAWSCRRELPQAPPPASQLAQVETLRRLGAQYRNSGHDSLRLIAHEMIRLATLRADTALLVEGQMLEINYFWRLSQYTTAMEQAIAALKNAQQAGLRDQVPVIYNVIGNLYKENENYPSALGAARQAVAAARANGDTAQLIDCLLNMGMFTHSYSMQRHDTVLRNQSLQIYLDGLHLAESSPRYEKARIAFYDNLSQYYKLTGDYKQGIDYGLRGAELARRYHRRLSLTYSYNWLGEIYFYKGEHSKGLGYLQDALQQAREIRNAYREMELNGSLYACYHAMGDDSRALRYLRRSMEIRESLQVEKNVRQIGLLHIQYETGRKDQEIASLAALNREKTKKGKLVTGALLLFALLSVFLFFLYRVLQDRNRRLTESNRKINEQAQQLQVLMRELHHRVKNNLQIVSSLLSLQSNHLADRDARLAVQIGQQRIEAMSLIHRSLYQQDSPNIINMQEYIGNLVESIMHSFGMGTDRFSLHLDVEVRDMDVDMALPLGLIINEWVTNAFKYAYGTVSHPMLWLSLRKDKALHLEIRDNGPGMARESWERPRGSFGVKLIKVLSRQLNGVCEMASAEGTTLRVDIPMKPYKKAV